MHDTPLSQGFLRAVFSIQMAGGICKDEHCCLGIWGPLNIKPWQSAKHVEA